MPDRDVDALSGREPGSPSLYGEPCVLIGSITGERHRMRYHIAMLYVAIGESGPERWERWWRERAANIWPWGQPDDPESVPEGGWPEMVAWW